MRDAVYQAADAAAVKRLAAAKGITEAAAAGILERGRENAIRSADEKEGDPYLYGYEPGIWMVTKALLRGVKANEYEKRIIRKRLGMEWEGFCDKIRRALGFGHPVGEVLIMGANRSGKTDFAAKLAIETAMAGKKVINIGLQTLPTGKQVQMPRVWHYLPKELKGRNIANKKATDDEEHISYTRQNGFASSKITFKNGSGVRFVSYDMDVNDAMEGSALAFCWLDEEFPKSFLDAARGRLASERGIFVGTFTPISGYTPVVADYLSDMQVVKWHTAYMLPMDGGVSEPWSELGLTVEEYTRLQAWRDNGTGEDPGVPESRPEDCLKWVLDAMRGPAAGPNAGACGRGRAFRQVPRVAICKGGEAAAVWFYGSDNPYGTPAEVIAMAQKNANAVGMIKKRVYGIAEKIKGRMFPEWTREKNVIRAEELPKRLVRMMVTDPAPERNWTAGWYGYDPAGDVLYKYRDWPGNYEIPGVGYPGPWAVPSDRKNGVNDGDKGEGQENFGMGFLAYKYEWARLEGWNDYVAWVGMGGDAMERPGESVIDEWRDGNGAREVMALRVIDSRAAAQSKMSAGANRSLFDEVSDLADGFEPASGQKIDVGINFLRDRIVKGKYLVTEDCVNTIFAYETYTGADGQKGACKDFMDCDRYAILSGITDFTAADARALGEEDAGRGPAVRTEGARQGGWGKTLGIGGNGRRIRRAGGR